MSPLFSLPTVPLPPLTVPLPTSVIPVPKRYTIPKPPPLPVHLLPPAPVIPASAYPRPMPRAPAPMAPLLPTPPVHRTTSETPQHRVLTAVPINPPYDVICPVCHAPVEQRCTAPKGKKPGAGRRTVRAHAERRIASQLGRPDMPLVKLRALLNERRNSLPPRRKP